jgi:hypothetical protein
MAAAVNHYRAMTYAKSPVIPAEPSEGRNPYSAPVIMDSGLTDFVRAPE